MDTSCLFRWKGNECRIEPNLPMTVHPQAINWPEGLWFREIPPYFQAATKIGRGRKPERHIVRSSGYPKLALKVLIQTWIKKPSLLGFLTIRCDLSGTMTKLKSRNLNKECGLSYLRCFSSLRRVILEIDTSTVRRRKEDQWLQPASFMPECSVIRSCLASWSAAWIRNGLLLRQPLITLLPF